MINPLKFFSDPAAEVTRCEKALEKWDATITELEAELAAARERGADIELGSIDTMAPTDEAVNASALKITALEVRIASLKRGRPKVAAALQKARADAKRAEAAAIREQIKPLQAEYDEHMSTVARLLKELQDYAGVPYVMNLRPVPAVEGGYAFMPNEIGQVTPKCVPMGQAIARLMDQADALERAAVNEEKSESA